MRPRDSHGVRNVNGTPLACLRRNHATADIVEQGIALQKKRGTKAAAEFLQREKVSLAVATRVLLYPALRRNYGAPVRH